MDVVARTCARRPWTALAAALVLLAALAVGVPAAPAHAAALAAPVAHPGAFHSVGPARVMDRTVAAVGTTSVTVTGVAGVPASGVGAVVLNVTVASPQRSGYVTVFPTGTTRPATSNLNFTAGRNVPNLTVVKVGTGGQVSFYNSSFGSTRLLADVSGYYEEGAATDAGAFQPLDPARVLDSGNNVGSPAVGPQGTASVLVAGRAGVPPTGAAAVVLNVTAATPLTAGYVTVYPSGTARPTTSTLNFPAGRTVPNLAVVKLGPDGKVNFYNSSSSKLRMVADVFGYVLSGTAAQAGAFQPLKPARILDTRPGSPLPARSTGVLYLGGLGGLPPYGGAAVVLNVTVTGARSGGYLTVWPTDQSRPGTSNLNFVGGQNIANLVVVRPTENGEVSFYNGSARAIDIVVDVSGSFIPAPAIHFRDIEAVDPGTGEAQDVSCASETFCVLVTSFGMAVRRDTSGMHFAEVKFGVFLRSVSCPTTTFCATVGQASASTYNGTTWASPVTLGSSSTQLRGVSCASSSFCMAVDTNNAYTYDGATWSSAFTLPSGGSYWSVSCASATFCVVVSLDGHATVWNGTSFSAAEDLGMTETGEVSCPSITFCAAVSEGGQVSFRTGSGWSSPTLLSGTDDLTAIDCRSSTFCVVGGSQGPDAFTWNGELWTRSRVGSPYALSCPSTTFCLGIQAQIVMLGTPV